MIVSIEEIYDDKQPINWIADTEHINPVLKDAIERTLNGEVGFEIPCNAGFQVECENPQARINPPCFIEASITLYCTGEYSDEMEELEFKYRGEN